MLHLRFVSQCLSKLPTPLCVVSYADSDVGHHGYIYQATNWIYTGLGGGTHKYIDGEGNQINNRSINHIILREQGGYIDRKKFDETHNITKEKALPKYRYLKFLGTKKQRREMKDALKQEILPYPKGDNERYEAEYEPKQHTRFF